MLSPLSLTLYEHAIVWASSNTSYVYSPIWQFTFFVFFFFQAEDGIRDWSVTGVQTCALPIYINLGRRLCRLHPLVSVPRTRYWIVALRPVGDDGKAVDPNLYAPASQLPLSWRSEGASCRERV